MEAQRAESEQNMRVDPDLASCRKKKSESATFLEDVKDHIDEFIHASMDEHKSCFKKTIQKVAVLCRCLACQKLLPRGI
ncbi:hypothetical protein KSP39_PZI009130 [Platanthera zijinensis]|uniref:Uncharacterized protein n=1 Tax=Platanthera zijinensis TaxID=2320716 RepID=A0AAP0BL41_9ASPA